LHHDRILEHKDWLLKATRILSLQTRIDYQNTMIQESWVYKQESWILDFGTQGLTIRTQWYARVNKHAEMETLYSRIDY
jgi:hypothetical protein